jgi:hypothetical protein
MGFYKNDSDGRKITLFPNDGDNNPDRIWATEQGLVTKAGGTDDPNASPEVLVASRGLDDAWGTAHVVSFEWKTNIRSRLKQFMNSEATILPEGYTMEQYLARVAVDEYSYNIGDWRGWLVACTVHFSEPVWVTGTNNISPRLKITLGTPGESAVTKYLKYRNTSMYANDYINDPPTYNDNIVNDLDDYITSFTVTNAGSGYTAPPEIIISDQGNPQAELSAVASAMIVDGAVSHININFAGKGYTAVPLITFNNTGTDGSGAAATANIIDRGDGTQGMTHSQYRNQYLYPNGSSSVTFAVEQPDEVLDFPGFMWAPGTTFAIPENAIDLNTSGTITEGTSAGGTNAVITNSASRGVTAGIVTSFDQLHEGWIYI